MSTRLFDGGTSAFLGSYCVSTMCLYNQVCQQMAIGLWCQLCTLGAPALEDWEDLNFTMGKYRSTKNTKCHWSRKKSIAESIGQTSVLTNRRKGKWPLTSLEQTMKKHDWQRKWSADRPSSASQNEWRRPSEWTRTMPGGSFGDHSSWSWTWILTQPGQPARIRFTRKAETNDILVRVKCRPLRWPTTMTGGCNVRCKLINRILNFDCHAMAV